MLRHTLITASALAVLTVWPLAARADVASCIAAAEHAQPLRASGRLLEARTELITCAAEGCPGTVRGDCVTWLTEVGKEIPTIVVQAKNGRGEDIADVRVLVDGTLLKPTLDGLPIPLNPGSRRVRLESAGREPVEQTVILRQGERRALSMIMPGPGETSASPVASTATSAEAPNGLSRSIPTISWVLGGAAVVLAGTGVTLWAIGKGEKTDLEDGCGKTSSCAHDDVVASRTKLIAGDVLVGAGLVALGVGVYFALSSRPNAASVSLSPSGISALGRF